MAIVKIDLDFKPPRNIIKQAVAGGTLAGANFVKKKADQFVNVGRWRRPAYTKGKYKGKTWTARRPGQLKRSGAVYKSKFIDGGSIVMYGSFNAYYGFMHHWGTTRTKKNPFLKRAEKSAASQIEVEIAGRIKAAIK